MRLLIVAYAALLAWAVTQHRVPPRMVQAVGVVNLLCFLLYWRDKRAAGSGGWRTSESRLHLFSLLGGWPAAWFAQQQLRHKSSKASFRSVYRATVFVHCCALAGWLWFAMPGPR